MRPDRAATCALWVGSVCLLCPVACEEAGHHPNVGLPHATADSAPTKAEASKEHAKAPATGFASTDMRQVCEQLCRLSGELDCANDASETCENDCIEMATPTVCQAPMRAFLRCAVHHSSDNWHCDEDQQSAVKDGVCETEQATAAACLEERLGS